MIVAISTFLTILNQKTLITDKIPKIDNFLSFFRTYEKHGCINLLWVAFLGYTNGII